MSSKATEIAKNLPTLEHPDGSPIRALVADDEEMLKELVSMGLKMIGWEVQSATDGPTALAIARDWRPDVLVLDIMMPGFDGLELLDRIRKFYPEVPCLFLTAKDSVDNRIEGLAAGADDEPAACTLVAATVADGLIRVGSIGDSRAYWFGDDGVSWQLTKDDSMAQARMMLGMPREEAERSLQAHSITRWLGRNATDVNPALVELRPDSPGWVVVCSDGLWNYASSPEDLAAVFEGAKQVSGNPVELAESLVAWANSCGGRDNITVALAYCEG